MNPESVETRPRAHALEGHSMFARLGLTAIIRLNAVMMVAFVAMTLVLASRLPPRFAVHFDRHGVANRWSGAAVLWTVPLLCVAMILLLHLVGIAISRGLESWSSKETDLSLGGPSDHRLVADGARRLLAWAAIGLTGMCMALQFGMYRVGVNSLEVLPTSFVWYPIAGFAFTLFVVLAAARPMHKWFVRATVAD